MRMLKFQTNLSPGAIFDGTQLDHVPDSDTSIEDVRFLLENDDETLIAYGREVTVIEVEEQRGETK